MGVVKTNALMVGSGSGGSGGANGADLPTHLNSISANGGNGFVTLTISYTNTNYVSGVQVNYKTDSYPTSPSDGEIMSVEGAPTSIKVAGLTNKMTYYFRVFLFNEVDNVKYYQTDITNARATCMPRAVEITGITPMVEGTDFLVFTQSGSGTISAPSGTKIIMGGNGLPYGQAMDKNGGIVGYTILTSDISDAPLTVTIAAKSGYLNRTTVKIGTATYDCANNGWQNNVIDTKWGPIGGHGGHGAAYDDEYSYFTAATSGTGAGGGGGRGRTPYDANSEVNGYGGNYGGYGNFGGNGGANGASGLAGSNYSTAYGGGGGGYAAGGGGGGDYNYDNSGGDGEAGAGIVVIEWST